MIRAFFTFLGRLYMLVMQIILAVVLGIVTWACWGLYQDEKLANQFLKEGQLVPVKIEDTSNKPLSWRDYLGNVSYLTFHYNRKAYTTRFLIDTLYVGTGDRVSLLYHPRIDAFRQPGQQFHFKDDKSQSRLIRWSMVNTFSSENRWLVACLFLSGIFCLFACGVLANITNWDFFGAIGRLFFVMLLLAGSIFFTYDFWEYHQYFQHLRTNGRQMTVKVLETDRMSYSTRQSRHWKSYLYLARVQLNRQERTIPLEEADYEVLKPGDSLSVLYDETLDDMMPVSYSMDYRQLWVVVFFWVITGVMIWKKGGRPAAKTKVIHP
jgi:hypothetical protein